MSSNLLAPLWRDIVARVRLTVRVLDFALVSILVSVLVLANGCAAPRVVAPPPSTGTLPAVELVTVDGKIARLGEVTRGRPALVALWATWCDACAKEFDALSRLYEASRASAHVVAIAVGEPRERVAEFLQRRPLPYHQLVDERFTLADALGQDRVPATLVLDGAGRIVYRGGTFDESALAALRSIIAENNSAPSGRTRAGQDDPAPRQYSNK
jgi:peroxiredoxin